jgi:hypothetical protein
MLVPSNLHCKTLLNFWWIHFWHISPNTFSHDNPSDIHRLMFQDTCHVHYMLRDNLIFHMIFQYIHSNINILLPQYIIHFYYNHLNIVSHHNHLLAILHYIFKCHQDLVYHLLHIFIHNNLLYIHYYNYILRIHIFLCRNTHKDNS